MIPSPRIAFMNRPEPDKTGLTAELTPYRPRSITFREFTVLILMDLITVLIRGMWDETTRKRKRG